MAREVRSLVAIKNSCLGTLGMTCRENESWTRDVFVRDNLAWLYRFTLSLLKQCKNNKSVAMNRRRCGWKDSTLLEILTGATTLVTADPGVSSSAGPVSIQSCAECFELII